MYIGTVLKIHHEGKKHYAVITGYDGKQVVVRFPVYKPGSLLVGVSIVEKTLPINETREVTDCQTTPTFVLLRQLVGIAYDKPSKPGKFLGQVGQAEEVD